jgi:hypothetical protein
MSSIRVSGNTSGYYDLTVPDIAGNNTLPINQIVAADSSGNVGIGTTSPNTTLDIVSPNSAEAINIRGRSADDIGQLKFYENDGTTSLARLDSRTTHFEVGSYNELRFSAGGVNNSHVVIDTSGNVGIGTDSPTAKLNVKSSSYPYVRVTNDGYTGLDIGQADSSEGGAGLIKLRDAADMDFYTADIQRMRISSTGNIGIGTGTVDPLRKLHLKDTGDVHILLQSSSADTNGEIFEIGAGANSSNRVDLTFRTRDNDGTAGNERMRITNGGDVGINTGSPASTLDVKGDLRITRNVDAGHASEGNWNFNISMESAAYYGSLYLVPSVSTGELSVMGDKFRVTQSSGVQIISDTGNSTSSDNVTIKYRGTSGGHKSGYLFKDKRDNVNGAIKNNLQDDSASNHGAHLELHSSQFGSLNRGITLKNSGKVEFDKMPNFATRPYYTNTELGSGAVVDFYDAHVNTGNHFNGTTNRFTAPYAGDYYFAFHSNIWKNAAGTLYFDWYANGSSQVSTYGGRIYGYYTGGWENIMGFVVLPLNANDYVELRAAGGSPKVDGGAYGQFIGYALTTP